MKAFDPILATQFLTVLFVLLILVRFLFRKPAKQDPISILQKRVDDGEIDEIEFDRLLRQLLKEEDLKMKSFFMSRI